MFLRVFSGKGILFKHGTENTEHVMEFYGFPRGAAVAIVVVSFSSHFFFFLQE